MLHQTPETPNTVEARIMAAGILKMLKTTPITVGGIVLPSPLNAPAVPISTLMKN